MATESMLSGGCIVSGAKIRKSVLFSSVEVEAHTLIENSVVLPDVVVGENCTIKRAVIDEGCDIPAGTRIGVDPEEDAKRFYVSPQGVTLVVPEMLDQHLHYVR